jgi:NADH dehydrogenase
MIEQVVTVFGASGFLGRHAVRALAKGGFGYRIRACSRHPNAANYLLPMGHVGQIQPTRINVLDADQVARVIAGSAAVVNLVGILYPAGGQSFHSVHAEAPAIIARAAREAGTPTLIHISTPGISPDSESAYARTKAEGEIALRREFPDATILRPSLVFGPEDKFFNKFAGLARFAPALPLIGGGHTRFQPVFVGDVARALTIAVTAPEAAGQTYELGGPATYSFRRLMELMLAEIERRRILLPIPFAAAGALGALGDLASVLLAPPITSDQVTLLRTDNIVSGVYPGLAELGIAPTTVESVLPAYLYRYRKGGQYADQEERALAT